jgi:chromosome segregation ATPase
MRIDQKNLEEAIKRHEENFEKELEEVDIRAVVLKTKKAVLEQALKNNSTYDHVLDQKYRVDDLQNKVNYYESRLSEMERELDRTKKIFTEAVALLQKENKPEPGFFTKFGDFLKCLLR